MSAGTDARTAGISWIGPGPGMSRIAPTVTAPADADATAVSQSGLGSGGAFSCGQSDAGRAGDVAGR
jgi:hypothetical protein